MKEQLNKKIKFAAMSLNWNDPQGKQFVPWLNEVRNAGYDGITGFGDTGCEAFMDNPNQFRSQLREYNLSLAALNGRMHTNYDDYKRMFEFMQAVGCEYFVCIDPAGTEKDYSKYANILNNIGELSLKYNVYTHYHNHTNAVGETYNDMERLMNYLDYNKVFLMLDIGHATKDFIELPVKERAIHFLKKHWEKIHYLEFKDWNKQSDLNTPVGEGYADWDSIFNLLNKGDYEGWITIEQNGNDGLSLNRSAYHCAKISRQFIKNKLGV